MTQSLKDKTPFISGTIENSKTLPPMKPEYKPLIMFLHPGHLDNIYFR